MRRVFTALVLAGALATSVADARADFDNADAVLRWINGYHAKPEPGRVPDAVRDAEPGRCLPGN